MITDVPKQTPATNALNANQNLKNLKLNVNRRELITWFMTSAVMEQPMSDQLVKYTGLMKSAMANVPSPVKNASVITEPQNIQIMDVAKTATLSHANQSKLHHLQTNPTN